MRTNYVLVDYENVQPTSLSLLKEDFFQVLVFLGAQQNKIPLELAAALQPMGARARYVPISANGPNALDFHIAFYIGKLAVEDPDAYFHIISKDTGFDPLIHHLKTEKIWAARSTKIEKIPILQPQEANGTQERIEVVVQNLRQRKASKPRAVKTLTSTVSSIFQKKLAENELNALIEALKKKGYVKVDGSKVSYNLPTNSA